jgi:hypothetical protein
LTNDRHAAKGGKGGKIRTKFPDGKSHEKELNRKSQDIEYGEYCCMEVNRHLYIFNKNSLFVIHCLQYRDIRHQRITPNEYRDFAAINPLSSWN